MTDPSNTSVTAQFGAGERGEAIIIEAPFYLRALLATMKSAKEKSINMNIWDRDIEAVEKAIAVIDAIRTSPVSHTSVKAVGSEALREALEPFAKLIDMIECTTSHDYSDAGTWEVSIGDLRRARSALAHPGSGDAEPGAWRTIETAPMDGARVLLYQTGRGAFEGWWHTDWHKAEAWWMDDADSEPEPTHWQPLLATPQAPAQTEGDKPA